MAAVVTVSLVLGLSSCAGNGAYVWVKDVNESDLIAPPITRVEVGDVLSVRVFGQDALSVRAPVRADGALSMPLVGQVHVLGRLPEEISKEIAQRLEPYVNGPHVMTVIDETHVRVVVAGEIRRPGTLVLDGTVDLLTAIANAGGITEFASETGIYVLRSTPSGSSRIRFTWEDISRGNGKAVRFSLRNNDQVIVE
jgi:polysaccharide biosynthesis/export protein